MNQSIPLPELVPEYNWEPVSEAWKEYTEEEKREHEKKKTEYDTYARKSYILNDFLAPIVDATLKNSSKERMFFRHVAEYADRNVDILTSPYFTKNMLFLSSDEEFVYSLFGVDKKEIRNKIKQIPKPPSNSGSVNITELRVLLLFIIGHYARTKEFQKMEYAYRYYAYSQFSTLFYSVGFRNGVVSPEAMEYTIDNMERKFNLKKQGSVGETVVETMRVTVMNFLKADKPGKADLRDLNDWAVNEICAAFKTRQAAWMKKIYANYKENLESKKYITNRGTEYDEESGDVIERDTVSGTVQKLSNKYTLRFFTTPISKKIVKIVSKRCNVSESELTNTLTMLTNRKYQTEIAAFYDALFQLFFAEDSRLTERDVRSAKFGAVADSIFRRSNSTDKLIIMIKDLVGKWLEAGSKVYRGTSRVATKTGYKRALYLYFVFIIIWN